MSNHSKRVLFHILGSITFLLLPVLFSPHFSLDFDFLSGRKIQYEMRYFFLLLIFFYATYLFLIPRFFDQKKYLAFFVIVLLLYLFISFLSSYGFHEDFNGEHWHRHAHKKHPNDFQHLIFHEFNHRFLKFLIVFATAILLSFNNKLKKVAKEKVEAELSFLKSQIKPHFLFNTLNSIYSLAIQKSNEVPQAIALFSSMLRYITNEAHKNFIPVNKELVYISSYVGLQKLRFEDTVTVEFYVEGSTDEREIAPLLLSTFVENAFKYGVNPEKKSVIKISVFVSETEICLTVFNNKVTDPKNSTAEGGVGLDNVKKRLQLLYPGQHELVINDEIDSYSILLKIKLK